MDLNVISRNSWQKRKNGRNHDLSVTEYKVAQESRKLADIKQQNNEEQEKNH